MWATAIWVVSELLHCWMHCARRQLHRSCSYSTSATTSGRTSKQWSVAACARQAYDLRRSAAHRVLLSCFLQTQSLCQWLSSASSVALQNFSVGGNGWSADGLACVSSALASVPALRILDLSHIDMSSSMMEAAALLLAQHMADAPSLQALSLAGNRMQSAATVKTSHLSLRTQQILRIQTDCRSALVVYCRLILLNSSQTAQPSRHSIWGLLPLQHPCDAAGFGMHC